MSSLRYRPEGFDQEAVLAETGIDVALPRGEGHGLCRTATESRRRRLGNSRGAAGEGRRLGGVPSVLRRESPRVIGGARWEISGVS
jgi:hypothetical protein